MKVILYFVCGVLAVVVAGLLWIFNQKPYPIIKAEEVFPWLRPHDLRSLD